MKDLMKIIIILKYKKIKLFKCLEISYRIIYVLFLESIFFDFLRKK